MLSPLHDAQQTDPVIVSEVPESAGWRKTRYYQQLEGWRLM